MRDGQIDPLGLQMRMLSSIAADMNMSCEPTVRALRDFFIENPNIEAEMQRRMPTEATFADWVDLQARMLLTALRGLKAQQIDNTQEATR